jgi:uncharacterized membrane protein
MVLTGIFVISTIALLFVPTGFEEKRQANAVRCRGRIIAADNSDVRTMGIVKIGSQELTAEIRNGPFKGKTVKATNQLIGKLELDKIFSSGDIALMVLSLKDGEIFYANAQDHYRLGTEILLLAVFSVMLVAFGGLTGLRALLSFLFTALMIWKVMIPFFLRGSDPVLVSLCVVTVITAAVIFLVGGISRRGCAAFTGALLGIGTTGIMAFIFSGSFRLHGAIKPFSETLLYSGYAHLSLTRIFLAGIFMASSGAVMDLAMDVAASMDELARRNPGLPFRDLLQAGFRVGRSVVGTMTTTLLLAYSGGFTTLLMVFMAQGVPLPNMFNLNYVAGEILHTLVGSFGLVTVAPFTALAGAFIYTGKGAETDQPCSSATD